MGGYTMFTRAYGNVLIEAFAHSKLPCTASATNPLARNCYQVWQTKFIIIVIIIILHRALIILYRYDYISCDYIVNM